MSKLSIVTHNTDKVKEFKELVGFDIGIIDFDIPEVQALDVKEVAVYKAQVAYQETGKLSIVEDTGLYIDAWNGLPGAFTRWFLEALGVSGICRVLNAEENRKSYIKTVIVLHGDRILETFTGVLEGEILYEPRGENGFGFDSIFCPKNSQKSLAEMTIQEKNTISTRRKTMDVLKEYITKHNLV